MYRIQTLNQISPVGLEVLPDDRYDISDTQQDPHGILVRSADMHSMDFSDSLLAIGRAGAGVNNIPLTRCSELGIAVFNAPGGNANGVKELVLAAMLLASRDIMGGIQWAETLTSQQDVATLVESEKKHFAGTEICGKKLGIVGLGAIGVLVANAAIDLGMEVYGVDPYISVESAWNLRPNVIKVEQYSELADCDFISLHLPLLDSTKGMVNDEFLSDVKKGVRILNFSRGGLVDNTAMKKALDNDTVAQYITDFPSPETVGHPGILNIPHLGASTEESEDNCAKMAALEVREYIEHGTILNSVNFPDCSLPYTGRTRLTIVHHNVPGIISRFLSEIGRLGVNVANMINKSKETVAYTIVDLDQSPDDAVIQAIESLDEVVRVRVIPTKEA